MAQSETPLSVSDWLAIIMPWCVVADKTIAAYAQQAASVYDLDSVAGYEKAYMQALYVAANQFYPMGGSSMMTGRITRRTEGDVTTAYAEPNKNARGGWMGTPYGEDFIAIIRTSRGGAILVGHAS